MFVFQKLDIYKNVSQKTLAERVRFSNTSADGYKYLAGVYFFVAHTKIYAIKASEKFWETYNPLEERVKDATKSILFNTQRVMPKPERK